MNLRESYLKPFVDLFKKLDDNNDGILNEKQFINLVKNMNIYDDNNFDLGINELLNDIDPYRNKQITFTDCVTLFSKKDENNETILDKLHNKE